MRRWFELKVTLKDPGMLRGVTSMISALDPSLGMKIYVHEVSILHTHTHSLSLSLSLSLFLSFVNILHGLYLPLSFSIDRSVTSLQPSLSHSLTANTPLFSVHITRLCSCSCVLLAQGFVP
jgi:hypothetical protein